MHLPWPSGKLSARCPPRRFFNLDVSEKVCRFSMTLSSRVGADLHRTRHRHPPPRSPYHALRGGRFLTHRRQPTPRLRIPLGSAQRRTLIRSALYSGLLGGIFGLYLKLPHPAPLSQDESFCLPFLRRFEHPGSNDYPLSLLLERRSHRSATFSKRTCITP